MALGNTTIIVVNVCSVNTTDLGVKQRPCMIRGGTANLDLRHMFQNAKPEFSFRASAAKSVVNIR